MLKKTVEYEDFNGNKQTETLYFNLSKPELIELEYSVEGGLKAFLEQIVASENVKELLDEFKRLVLAAYGEKSEDGKRFIKSDELREAFSQTAAYEALYMELMTSDTAAASFFNGIIPADISAQIDQDKPVGPPPQTPPPLPPTTDTNPL